MTSQSRTGSPSAVGDVALMGIFGEPKLSERAKLESLAGVLTRAGTLDGDAAKAEVSAAARADAGAPNSDELAEQLVSDARDELYLEQQTWPETTDYDHLQVAFAALEAQNIAVLQSVEDHWRANALLTQATEAGSPYRGVVWFTAPDVWHAIEHGMLEINVWHGDTANIAAGDALLDAVIEALAAQGIDAHFDEGRVEVTSFWRRR